MPRTAHAVEASLIYHVISRGSGSGTKKAEVE
jgi:hypothetical protein